MAHRDPLNFYSPYERLPAGHENQLTRALLVLLRMSPIAHSGPDGGVCRPGSVDNGCGRIVVCTWSWGHGSE
jgi:hypothetical protein